MTDTTDDRKKVADLIKDFRFAMFTTRQASGKLVARPFTVQEAEFDGDLWFLVSKTSSPVVEIAGHDEVCVSMSSSDTWVSLSGTARLVDDHAKIEELWNPMVEAWFPNGPQDPDVGLVRFTAESAEYWDTPGGRIATLFNFVKSKVTGEQFDGGESGTVEL